MTPVGLLRSNGKRPDGESLVPWKRGRNLLWAATCVHRLANSWVTSSVNSGTPAADTSESRKRAKYKELCEDYIFEPVAVETLGGIGRSSFKFLQQVGHRLQESTGDQRASVLLLQRLSVAVQKGNAGCILECMGNTNNAPF